LTEFSPKSVAGVSLFVWHYLSLLWHSLLVFYKTFWIDFLDCLHS
jgi:hypothetical protein